MNASDNILKNLCLFDEIETSSKLIKLGLGELQNINFNFVDFKKQTFPNESLIHFLGEIIF